VDFVEICNVYVGKMIIKAAKRIFNSDKIRHSYSDLSFGVTFLEHSVYSKHLDIEEDRQGDKLTAFQIKCFGRIVKI